MGLFKLGGIGYPRKKRTGFLKVTFLFITLYEKHPQLNVVRT
jgi:hypothetical protein